MLIKMKPETIKRRAKERKQAIIDRKETLNKRLADMARVHGPDSIWADMLKERTELERQATENVKRDNMALEAQDYEDGGEFEVNDTFRA